MSAQTSRARLEVESQVAFGRRFAAAMPGPVQARGNQLDGGRIHRMNGAPESPQGAAAFASPRKLWTEVLQMPQYAPEKLFRHLGVANLVGMRKVVAAGRRGPANGRKRPPVQIQRVTHVVETDAGRHLGEHHGHGMTPRRKGSPLLVHPILARQFRHQMRRNQIAQLVQNAYLRFRWMTDGFLFHVCRVADQPPESNTSFKILWDGCESKF
jgi:hypothetical protein